MLVIAMAYGCCYFDELADAGEIEKESLRGQTRDPLAVRPAPR
jgi:hypothetical protein